MHRLPDGKFRLIQCKRYGRNVDVAVIRGELAKICCNVFHGVYPESPDEVVFYVASDLTSDALTFSMTGANGNS